MNAPLMTTAAPMPGPCPVIETARLRLRPHRMGDADAIVESLTDYQVVRMLARVPVPYDRQDATDWLSRATSGITPDWSFAITDGDDVHLGVVAIELRHGQWHLGYWLNRYYWGKGLMSEAAGGAIERFFRRMPDAVLHSGAFADNAASLRIQEKLGFAIVRCGELYSRSRNAVAPHIDTRLTQAELRQR
ncbi:MULTISPECIES: GNAT family N-acetyltransferase [Alphaproteobacteria]|uniref:N-acetyltransferase n=2 Tax=Alphaproteobacteria TaxID=28211 RepID=A0A512HK20_9HYPH|nr:MULTISPECIES: GNAT family N-acetyltransferase [Alphaproteobacteria]GEO85802.1 N-acetyltransferase [Ciceribacter naphthalenivorans]GLR21658.1 N-acetyltransferase [Ciceribacter naphthalenivorans]GLT04514.1 N-acetyltransferase [Sphingomonas psychrolutea]